MQENICKKYGITREELKKGAEIVVKSAGQNICNVKVLVAITDLLVAGDIIANIDTNKFTNREWLNTLSYEEYAEAILRKSADLESKYMNSDLENSHILDCIEMDMTKWLKSKHTR